MWKRSEMVKEDIKEQMVRMAHTIERQVFEARYYLVGQAQEAVEMKVMEVMDMFMRDSSLGQFQARLAFLGMMLSHLKNKSK